MAYQPLRVGRPQQIAEHMDEPTPTVAESPERQRALRESLSLASDLADALETQIGRLKRQCRELDQTLSSLPEEHEAAAQPAAAPQVDAPQNEGGMGDPARLAAVAMAMQGHTREDVAAYLQSLDVENTDEILASVFPGAESA